MPVQVYEQLTLFPGDSPANPSPWLESKKDKMMIATFGRRCEELSENLRRVGLSVRMYLESCTLPLPTLYRTWSVSVMTSRCLLLRLRLSVRSTGESDSSLWPTVTTMDHLPSKSEEALMREASVARPGRTRPANLRDCVNPESMAMWPTPTAMDARGLEYNLRKDATETRSILLSQKAALYPTVKATDYKGSGPAGSVSAEHAVNGNNQAPKEGTKRGKGLATAVRMWPTPIAVNCGMTATTGGRPIEKSTKLQTQVMLEERKLYTTPCAACSTGSTGGNNHRDLRTDIGGQLNPPWVEWLMGFPIGWTELSASETPYAPPSIPDL